MSKVISQRELRNQSGEVMRGLDRGETFIITRNGIPVGELRPVRRQFVSREAIAGAVVGAPAVDAARFRRDLDEAVDQDIEPRA